MCAGDHRADGSREINLELPGGKVLETVQPVDGGRWGKTRFISLPGFAFFQVPLFPALLSLDHSFPLLHPYPFFPLFPSSLLFCLLFLLTLYLSSSMLPTLCLLPHNPLPIPLPLPSQLTPKSSLGTGRLSSPL